MDTRLASGVRSCFGERFGGAPPRVAIAPGRVNLIGEHTDYNDGFALPMAIDRGVAVAFRKRADRRLRAFACAYGQMREADLDDRDARPPHGDWMAYVSGVGWAFESTGRRLPGLDMVIAADLPIGAGLSSSAALAVAVARAFTDAASLAWDPAETARLCQKAENEFVGTGCGLMDPFVSAAAREGCALLLDCRSLATEAVALPDSAAVVVMDTGRRRSLATSAYNERRAACEEAVSALRVLAPGIQALRDVDVALLETARDLMDPVVFRRARHVVEENRRPAAMAAALRRGDLEQAGRLMDDSHASLRDLYEVSSPELDFLTDAARNHPACYGARLTGAGFGGCAIALVGAGEAPRFQVDIERTERAGGALSGSFLVYKAEAGAKTID